MAPPEKRAGIRAKPKKKKWGKIKSDKELTEKNKTKQREKRRKFMADLEKTDPEEYRKRRPHDRERSAKRVENMTEEEKSVLRSQKRDHYHNNKTQYQVKCTVCELFHWSKVYETCDVCRIGLEGVQSQELEIKQLLQNENLYFSTHNRRGPCGDTRYRPDFLVYSTDMPYLIILEVDENKHMAYSAECEIARNQGLKDQFREMPVVLVRYAPHRVGQFISPSSKNLLLSCIKTLLEGEFKSDVMLECGITSLYIGYDEKRVAELVHTKDRMDSETFINSKW